MIPRSAINIFYESGAEDAARFYAATFPDVQVTNVHMAEGDYQGTKSGDVLYVEFTVAGIPCAGINAGPGFPHSVAMSFQFTTEDQEETDRYWNAIVGNGGSEGTCGWCTDRWGISWQLTPRIFAEALRATGPEAKRVADAIGTMTKCDVAAFEAAREG